MKTFSILFFFFLSSVISHGQKNGNTTVWEFYQELQTELAKDCSDSCDSLDRLALEEKFFKVDTARIGIDTLAKYQLLFKFGYEWTDVIGQGTQFHFSANLQLASENPDPMKVKIIELPKTEIIRFPKNGKIYSGNELFHNLVIEKSLLSSTEPIKTYPDVYERNDSLNCEWLPVSSGEYLILRYVHSYPDGNVTSFYNEMILYFRKVE